jgi:hypothetical protein
MPVFTFEKISPPVRHKSAAATEKKQRSRIVQLLDRFTEARTRRSLRKDRSEAVTPQKPLE